MERRGVTYQGCGFSCVQVRAPIFIFWVSVPESWRVVLVLLLVPCLTNIDRSNLTSPCGFWCWVTGWLGNL